MADLSKVAAEIDGLRGIESALAQYQNLVRSVEKIQATQVSALETAMIPRGILEALSRQVSSIDSVTRTALAAIGPIDAVSRNMARISAELASIPRLAIPAIGVEKWLPVPKISEALKLPDMPKLALQTHIAQVSGLDIVSRAMREILDSHRLGNFISPAAGVASQLQSGLLELSEAHSSLFERLTAKTLIDLPPWLTRFPAVEFFNHVDTLAATSIRETDPELDKARARERALIEVESGDDVVGLLSSEFPELLHLLEGARAAWANRHPDWIRHFAISLRELFTKLLHELAPDEAIRSWSTSAADFHNGRPTRKARLRFLCEPIASGGFLDFVTKDVDALATLVDIFQEGTHSVAPAFPDLMVNTLKVRMETAISYLLQIRLTRC